MPTVPDDSAVDTAAPDDSAVDDLAPRGSDLLERYGTDAVRLAERLAVVLQDNHALRGKNRTLRQQVSATPALPAGHLVLTAEQAAQWAAYQQLGTPDVLQQQITATAQTARDLLIRQAADAAHLDAAKLARLITPDMEVTITPAMGDAPAQACIVRDGTAIPIREDGAIAPFLSALDQSPARSSPVRQPLAAASPSDPVAAYLASINTARHAVVP